MNLKTMIPFTVLIFSYAINSMNESIFQEGKEYCLSPFKEAKSSKGDQEDRPLQKQILAINESWMKGKPIKKLIQSIQLPETIALLITRNSNSVPSECSITNKTVKYLNHFSNLKYLILHNAELQNFTGIDYLYRLVELRYYGNGYTKLTSLKGLEKSPLKGLTVKYCSYLNAIEENTLPSSLESLTIKGCPILSLAGISNLSALKLLSITHTPIQTLGEVKLPDSIEYLDASFNNIFDINGLQHCANLKTLNLYKNKIKDPHPLLSLIKEGTLKEVNLAENPFLVEKFNKLLTELSQPTIINDIEEEIKKHNVILSLENLFFTVVEKEREEINKRLLVLAAIKKSRKKEREKRESRHEHFIFSQVLPLIKELKKENNEKK